MLTSLLFRSTRPFTRWLNRRFPTLGNAVSRSIYHRYLRTAYWRRKRRKILKRSGWLCEVNARGCLMTTDLDIHHDNYDRVFRERLTDLRVACRPCHIWLERMKNR